MLAKAYLSKWNEVPQAVKSFLLKALVILVVWKIVYLGFLSPARLLDQPLTASVGKLSAVALNLFTRSADYTSKPDVRDFVNGNESGRVVMQDIVFKGRAVGAVEDACNALELFVLYVSFIWILPSSLKRRIAYTVIGVAAIYIVNVARCAGITYMLIYYPQHADFAHHYIFAFIVYAFIIVLWLMYSNKVSFDDAKADQ